MGAGAGIVIPMGQALLSIMLHGKDLSRAMTAWAIAGTLGVPFGPVVGGAVTAAFGWRGIFGFDAVVFLAVMALIHATARTAVTRTADTPDADARTESASGKVARTANARATDATDSAKPHAPASNATAHTPLDIPWPSVALMFAGFSALSAGLIDAQHTIVAPSAWIPMLAGATLIVGFVAYDHHARNPLMELSLMRDPSFAANAPALLMLNFSMYGIIFIMPAYLETVMGHGALVGGLLLMPLVLASIVGSLCNSRIIARIGYRATSIGSLIALAVGMAAMGVAVLRSGTGLGWTLLIVGQTMAGLGLGAGQPAMLTWAMGCVPAEHSGAGSSLLTVFRQFGSIIGVGLFGSISGGVYAARFQSDASAAGASADPDAFIPTSAGSVALDFQQAQRLTGQVADLLRRVAAEAYESSMLASFLIAALVIAITTVVVAAISRKHGARSPRTIDSGGITA